MWSVSSSSCQLCSETSNERDARAESLKRAALEALVECRAGARLERPRRIDSDGGLCAHGSSEAERRRPVVPLHTKRGGEAEPSVPADLHVGRGRPSKTLPARIVVTVVKIARRTKLIRRDPEVEVQSFGSRHAPAGGEGNFPPPVAIRQQLVRHVERHVRGDRREPIELNAMLQPAKSQSDRAGRHDEERRAPLQ